MSLLKKDQLQKSAGLLNSSAPEDHFLAYITAEEKDMLVHAGGKETPTASGIKAYPGHHGVSGESMGVAQHPSGPREVGPPGPEGPSGDTYYDAPPTGPDAEKYLEHSTYDFKEEENQYEDKKYDKHYNDYQEFLEYDRTRKGEKPENYFVANRSEDFNDYLKNVGYQPPEKVDYQPPEKSVAQEWYDQYGDQNIIQGFDEDKRDPLPSNPFLISGAAGEAKLVDAEDEYLEPDKDHWIATQKAIKKGKKAKTAIDDQGNLVENWQADWTDLTKEQQEIYQEEMNRLKGTEGKRYSFYKGNEGTINLSFNEHWKDTVVTNPVLKFSPIMRFLVAAGRTIKENATTDYGTWKYGGAEGSGSSQAIDQGGWLGRVFNSDGSVNENLTEKEANDIYNQVQPNLPFKEPPTSDSPAAKWFEDKNYSNNTFNFSFQNEYNEAKARQASILGNPSPMKYLAVNQSPYYDFLKKNKLDRGIL